MLRTLLIYGFNGIVLFEKEWVPLLEKVGSSDPPLSLCATAHSIYGRSRGNCLVGC